MGSGPCGGARSGAVWLGRIVTLGRSCSRISKSTSDHVSCPSERLNGQ